MNKYVKPVDTRAHTSTNYDIELHSSFVCSASTDKLTLFRDLAKIGLGTMVQRRREQNEMNGRHAESQVDTRTHLKCKSRASARNKAKIVQSGGDKLRYLKSRVVYHIFTSVN